MMHPALGHLEIAHNYEGGFDENVASPCHKIAYIVIRKNYTLKGNLFCFPKRVRETAVPLFRKSLSTWMKEEHVEPFDLEITNTGAND
jgi:hypothetical protein